MFYGTLEWLAFSLGPGRLKVNVLSVIMLKMVTKSKGDELSK